MVLPVHLLRLAVAVVFNCPSRSQFIESRSLKQPALQSIWLFQESLSRLQILKEQPVLNHEHPYYKV
jgi:hypothetical protein